MGVFSLLFESGLISLKAVLLSTQAAQMDCTPKFIWKFLPFLWCQGISN